MANSIAESTTVGDATLDELGSETTQQRRNIFDIPQHVAKAAARGAWIGG
jgi:hypothetical protein